VNFVFYGQEGSIFEINFPLVKKSPKRVRFAGKVKRYKNRSSQEEAIGEHT